MSESSLFNGELESLHTIVQMDTAVVEPFDFSAQAKNIIESTKAALLDKMKQAVLKNQATIEPLDSAATNNLKRKQPESNEVWMEPKELCDFVIKYDTLVLHAHKSVLAVNTKHFASLFSFDKEAKETEIPMQYNMIDDKIVLQEDFLLFMEWMYKPSLVKSDGKEVFLAKIKDIGYLVHYFDTPVVQDAMENKILDSVTNITYDERKQCLEMYVIWCVYDWSIEKIEKLLNACACMVSDYYRLLHLNIYNSLLKRLPRWGERLLLLSAGKLNIPLTSQQLVEWKKL